MVNEVKRKAYERFIDGLSRSFDGLVRDQLTYEAITKELTDQIKKFMENNDNPNLINKGYLEECPPTLDGFKIYLKKIDSELDGWGSIYPLEKDMAELMEKLSDKKALEKAAEEPAYIDSIEPSFVERTIRATTDLLSRTQRNETTQITSVQPNPTEESGEQALLSDKDRFVEQTHQFTAALDSLNTQINISANSDVSQYGAMGALLNYAMLIKSELQDLNEWNDTQARPDLNLQKQLTEGLTRLEAVVSARDIDQLIKSLEDLDKLKSSLPDIKKLTTLNHNLSKLLCATLVTVVAGLYVALALKLPFLRNIAIGLDVVTRAMGMPIPGLAGLISYESVAINAVMGVAGAYALKAGMDYYRESNYKKELVKLEETIQSMKQDAMTDPASKLLLEGAQEALEAIKLIKWSGDKSISSKELTTGLKIINDTLSNPSKWEKLQNAAIFGESLPPKSSVAMAYLKFLAPLSIVVGVGLCLTAVAFSNAPGLSLLAPSILAMGSKLSMAGMAAASWTIPVLPLFLTGGALLPQMVVGKTAGLIAHKAMDYQEGKAQPDKLQITRNDIVQGTFKEEKSDTATNNLARTMQAFKKKYTEQIHYVEKKPGDDRSDEPTPESPQNQ